MTLPSRLDEETGMVAFSRRNASKQRQLEDAPRNYRGPPLTVPVHYS